MSKLAELDNETINRIKVDSIKFDNRLGFDGEFMSLFDRGLILIAGEKDGELLYTTSKNGNALLKDYEESKPNV